MVTSCVSAEKNSNKLRIFAACAALSSTGSTRACKCIHIDLCACPRTGLDGCQWPANRSLSNAISVFSNNSSVAGPTVAFELEESCFFHQLAAALTSTPWLIGGQEVDNGCITTLNEENGEAWKAMRCCGVVSSEAAMSAISCSYSYPT